MTMTAIKDTSTTYAPAPFARAHDRQGMDLIGMGPVASTQLAL